MDESIVKHLQPQVGTLRLSEAIRRGAKIRPQCKHYYEYKGASCALGAAAEAVWGDRGAGWPERFIDEFGITLELFHLIGAKNDSGMTREQVADWLESQGL